MSKSKSNERAIALVWAVMGHRTKGKEMELKGLYVDVLAGHSIDAACKDAIAMARLHGKSVYFVFNGVMLTAHADSTMVAMINKYRQAMADCVTQTIIAPA